MARKCIAMKSLRALYDTHHTGKPLKVAVGSVFGNEVFIRIFPQGKEHAPEGWVSADINMG